MEEGQVFAGYCPCQGPYRILVNGVDRRTERYALDAVRVARQIGKDEGLNVIISPRVQQHADEQQDILAVPYAAVAQ